MVEISNMRNKRTLELSIADLAIVASGLQTAVATALCYGKIAESARVRLRELEKKVSDLCPLNKWHRKEGYSWFNAFSAMPTCSGYAVIVKEESKGWVGERDIMIAILVDGKIHPITEKISVGKGEGLPEEVQKQLNETKSLLEEAANFDAEIMSPVTIQLDIDEKPRGGYHSEQDLIYIDAVEQISGKLQEADKDDMPFYVFSTKSAWKEKHPNRRDVSVYVRPSDQEVFMTTMGAEFSKGMKP